MPFPPRLLSVGEEVAVETRPHWTYLAGQAGAFVLLGVALIVVVAVGFPLPAVAVAGALAGVVAVALGIRLVRWANTYYVVTNHRIVYWRGLPAWRGSELRIELVEEVVDAQTPWGRLLGVGTLSVRSVVDGHVRNFGYVPRPAEVRRAVYLRTRAGSIDYPEDDPATPGGVGGAAGPEVTPDGLSIPEQILQLYELVKLGIVSESEFEDKKRELLGRL